ncbi:AraC-like DNA-binding protein [Paenibacillus mucilaginosus]|uniref:AraC family transcriptional regulator n=1 Tax=Paenibacillus mucilaginosus TaxID=61624 RepID=UPI003D1DE904
MQEQEHLFFPQPAFPHYPCYPDYIGGFSGIPSHVVQRPARTTDLRLDQLYNLHFVLGGRGYVDWRDQRYELGIGDGFLYGPGLPQRYGADRDSPWDIRWVHFATNGLESMLGTRGMGEVWIFHMKEISKLHRCMEELFALGRAFDLEQEARASVLLYELLVHLMKEAAPIALPRETAVSSIHRAADYIRANCTEALTLADMAEYAGYSVPYFSRKFHGIIGKTPTAYLLESRVLLAKQMLVSTPWTVKEIASAAGFAQSSYFIHCFKRLVHMTPEQFRSHFKP